MLNEAWLYIATIILILRDTLILWRNNLIALL